MTRAQKRVMWILWCCLWAAVWATVAAAAWPRQVCGLSLLVDMRCMVWETSGSIGWAVVFAAVAAGSLAGSLLPVAGRDARPDRKPGAPAGDARIGLHGPIFSGQELEELWITYGGNPQHARLAAAVALAESGGYAGAVSGTDWRVGLWQPPVWADILGKMPDMYMTQPILNVGKAIEFSRNGEDWSWSVGYTSGIYRQFLPGGER